MKKLIEFYKAYNKELKRKEKQKEKELKVNGLMKILFSIEDSNESIEVLKEFNKKAEKKLSEIAIDSAILHENINEYFKTK